MTGGSSANTLAGVAVTGDAATAAQGTWQWLNGATWTDISTGVSDSSALILAAGTAVRFNPAADFNGTPGSLTVHLIDNSQGPVTSGDSADLTTAGSGGITRYSTGTVTIGESVTAVDDAPVDHVPGPQSVVQNQTLVFSGPNAISITDVDANGADVTVTLAVGSNGTLTLSDVTGLTFTTGDGLNDATMTFSGNLTAINAALAGLSYTGSAIGPDTLTVTANDNGHSGVNPAGDVVATVAITVQQPLTLDLDGDNSTASGNDYAALVTAPGVPVAIADIDTTITSATNSPIVSATVSITAGTYQSAEDVLAFTNSDPTLFGDVTELSNTAGVLTLTGTTATYTQWQNALHAVTYADTSATPNTLNRTIDVAVTDATSSISLTAVTTVYFHTLDLDSTAAGTGHTATFTELDLSPARIGNPATTPISGITITDADGASVASATVTLTDAVTGQDFVTVGGASGNTGTLASGIDWSIADTSGVDNKITVTFTTHSGSSPSVADYEAALQQVGYSDNSFNPNTTDRHFTVAVADSSGALTNTAVATIHVVSVNEAPTINTAAVNQTMAETDAALVASGTVGFSDVDNGDTPSATVTGQTVSTSGITLTAGQISALENAFTIDAAGNWSFNVASPDFLAAGQSMTLTSTVTVDDHHGGTTTQDEIITITGSDDAPAINSAAVNQTIAETDAALTTSGTVGFSDVDTGDTPSATVTAQTVTSGGITLTNAQIDALKNAFTIDPAGTWSFNLASPDFPGLRPVDDPDLDGDRRRSP